MRSARQAVLVVSTRLDAATDAVCAVLREQDVPVMRLDTEDFPLAIGASYEARSESGAPFFEWDGRQLSDADFAGVWYRRHRLPEFPTTLNNAEAEYCLRESTWFMRGMLMALREHVPPVMWMSDPLAVHRSDSKILQLTVARECGLEIPATLVTNDPVRLRIFRDRTGDARVVAKALRLGYFDDGDNGRSVHTTVLDSADFDDDESIRIAPVIYQELVAKASDVRVTIVGREVFAAAIESQEEPSAVIDWRASTRELRHDVHDLPSRIADGCVRLMRALGLSYGAIDLILRPTGEYCFLEVNPNGQWLWLDDKLTLGITDAVARWLMTASRTGMA